MRALWVIFINGALSATVIAFSLAAFKADEMWPFVLPAPLIYPGGALLAAGAMLILAAEASFVRKAHATGATGDAPPRLVTSGPFRCVRNPIYLGAALLLLGIALVRRSPTFLVAAFAACPAFAAYVRGIEEPRLERRFGDVYRRYRETVPPWIPVRRKRAAGGAAAAPRGSGEDP